MKTIIGFAGRKGAGKDTAAKVFEAHRWEHLKMAGAIKAMLRTLLSYQGLDEHTIWRMLEGDLKEVPTEYLNGHTPRWAMQSLGTEWGRDQMGADFWVRIFLNAAHDSRDPVVCSDVRFPNEVQAIHDAGGQVYRVERLGTEQSLHPSEAMIDDLEVDGVIFNRHDSAEEFADEVARMMGPHHRA